MYADNKKYKLYEGDSATFNSSLPHWKENETEELILYREGTFTQNPLFCVLLSLYCQNTCGDSSRTIKKKVVIFAEVPLKTTLFMFLADIANYRNKHLKEEIVVRLGFRI